MKTRTVAERYIPKTNPFILLISTPNLPGGLFERMEDEKDNGYVMKQMDYTIGLNKVFKPEDIETAKKSPSFEREYNLKYGFWLWRYLRGVLRKL